MRFKLTMLAAVLLSLIAASGATASKPAPPAPAPTVVQYSLCGYCGDGGGPTFACNQWHYNELWTFGDGKYYYCSPNDGWEYWG